MERGQGGRKIGGGGINARVLGMARLILENSLENELVEFLQAYREVRRRTRTMSWFTKAESVDRIIYGVMDHLNRS